MLVHQRVCLFFLARASIGFALFWSLALQNMNGRWNHQLSQPPSQRCWSLEGTICYCCNLSPLGLLPPNESTGIFLDPGFAIGKPTGHHDDSENHDRSDGDCGLPWGSLMPILQHLQGILPGGCTTGCQQGSKDPRLRLQPLLKIPRKWMTLAMCF